MKCSVCGDTLVKRSYKVLEYKGMGVYRNVTHYRIVCPHCEWSGLSGPGIVLKEAIKELNT